MTSETVDGEDLLFLSASRRIGRRTLWIFRVATVVLFGMFAVPLFSYTPIAALVPILFGLLWYFAGLRLFSTHKGLDSEVDDQESPYKDGEGLLFLSDSREILAGRLWGARAIAALLVLSGLGQLTRTEVVVRDGTFVEQPVGSPATALGAIILAFVVYWILLVTFSRSVDE